MKEMVVGRKKTSMTQSLYSNDGALFTQFSRNVMAEIVAKSWFFHSLTTMQVDSS
jgi:hypothetical protein